MRNYGGQAMNRLYETKDGQHIALAGNEPKFCENLLAALGRPDFIALAKGEPGPSQAPLIDYFTALFKTKTRAEWETFLSKHRSVLGAAAQPRRTVSPTACRSRAACC